MFNLSTLANLVIKPQKLLGLLIIGLVVFNPLNIMAASFDFNPSSTEFTAGCRNGINIMADATGRDSNAADIELYYNPSEIDIIDSIANIPGTQIKPGEAYETYFGNEVNNTTGRIRLAGASFVSSLNARKVFATIEFTSKPGITTTSFAIKFDGVGATLDSNIADASTSDDLLSSVTNGTYTFKTGNCTADRIPPVITFQSPPKFGVNIPLDQNVTIKITDNQSGVDLTKTTIEINGDIYTISSPEVTYTGSLLNYTFTINPRNNFFSDRESTIRVTTSDLAGNRSADTNTFNIPIPILKETICPDAVNGGTTLNPDGTAASNSGGTGTNGSGTGNGSTNTSSGGQNNQGTNTTTSGSTSSNNSSIAQNSQNLSNNSSGSGISTGDTDSISNETLTNLILARTGGSLKDILIYNYWWGIPLLIIILVLILNRNRWLKNKDKTKLR